MESLIRIDDYPIRERRDLIIVGGGPCGLAAALIAAQNGLKPLIIDKGLACGGQLLTWIDFPIRDVPSYPSIVAPDLAEKLLSQVKEAGVEICGGQTVHEITSTANQVYVSVDNNLVYAGSSALICTGVAPRTLHVPGENSIAWGNPHANAQRSGMLCVVIGGGDEACSASLSLAASHAKVILIARGNISARHRFFDPVKANPAIEIWRGEQVSSIESHGEQFLFKLASGKEVLADAAFIRIGMQPFIPKVLPRPAFHADGRLTIDSEWRTTTPLIYAGGDAVRPPAQRYISIALADGVGAARAIANDLSSPL